jgi:hypothetical protein
MSRILSVLLLCSSAVAVVQAQVSPLKTFGYFQNSVTHETGTQFAEANNSFVLQQLNLFLQTDLSDEWRAFVNFEILNSFSSSRRWGAFNIEEAWARYRPSPNFNLKLGLQIPVFNQLNEIKNRAPLLPYVVRPLVYETSFGEFIDVEEFTPARAFVQSYGFLPAGSVKFDYSLYIGNSPNIVSRIPEEFADSRQTGVDTTDTFLLGGRTGIRYDELTLGVSLTHDKTNILHGTEKILGAPDDQFKERRRTRFGADLSFHTEKISFWGEWIYVDYDLGFESIEIDRRFYYGTLGYRINEPLFVYASYWDTFEHALDPYEVNGEIRVLNSESDIDVWTVGLSYHILDNLALKAQFASVEVKRFAENVDPEFPFPGDLKVRWQHYGAAISVMF